MFNPVTSIETKPHFAVEALPTHVGIIMDGNGRWARSRGLPRLAGHRAGVENVRRIVRACVEFGIAHLTIYAFSTENWGRPADEVNGLLSIIDGALERELGELHKQGVKLCHFGQLENLAPATQQSVRKAVALTRHNERLVLNIAFNYGGRSEIVHAIRNMVRDGIPLSEITEDRVSCYLYTAGQPDPDLIIRTAGDLRLSNFLLWQSAYSEFYSTDVYWPDFDRTEFAHAIECFGSRVRRFGGLTSKGYENPD